MQKKSVKLIYKRNAILMGNSFEFVVSCEKQSDADFFIQSAIDEIKRLEFLLSTFVSESETNKVNKYAGEQPVRVNTEVFGLVERSIAISKLTQGAFDITYGSVSPDFFNFNLKMGKLPSKVEIKNNLVLVGYKNIILDKENKTVFLKKKGMKIGFGGIGKGFAAEKAKHKLIALGLENGIINASGDLTAWGNQPNGEEWTAGIVDPSGSSEFVASIPISGKSVATSGDYEKFVVIDNKKYSHTIDPKTGYPVSGVKSATVISPNAEFSDALTKPLIIMGVKKGIFLINQLKNVACVIIDDKNNINCSKNLSHYHYNHL